MAQDLRYAIRTLVKTPGYTLVALLALALGIGANTAIFSFVDIMLLRPLPYPHADRLYATVSINPGRGLDRASVSYADYEDWKRETGLFDGVALFQPGAASVSGGIGDPERVDALTVSEDFFRVVDVQPIAGRALGPADNTADAARAAVISFAFWQRRFGGDPTVVGKDLRIGGVPHTIVGVVGPRAIYPEETELFLPLVPSRFAREDLSRRDNLMFSGLARLAEGASRTQAEARMRAMASRLEQDDPRARKGWSNGLVPLREYIVEPELATALYVLLAAVGAVLLIACANLANLTLVRGAGRGREMGLRVALGAKRGRLIRQLVAESAVLGVAGGTLGIACAAAAIPALAALVPADAPFIKNVTLDGRVMLASAAMTLIAVVAVGLLPALSTSGIDIGRALKEGARGSSQGRKTSTLRSVLVVGEIATAVVLLVAAGLLLRSLARVTSAPPGADVDRVLAARISVPGSRYTFPQRTGFFDKLTAQLMSAPGVQAAAVTSYLPAGGGGFGLGRVFLSEGQSEPPAGQDVPAMWCVISPQYFRTLGIPLVSGRPFEAGDGNKATPVMIVSRSFAERMFPGQDAIGRRVRSWRDENVYREIVGVVNDVPFSSLTDRSPAIVYVPHAQQGWGGMTIAVRAAAGSPELLTSTLRQAVKALDPELPLADIGTMAVFARSSIARERLSASLMGALAALALALAVLGVYGIMSYSVALRRQEMGVRLALGAAPGDLYRLVLGRGLALTFVGLAIGLIGALAASRALQTLLYQTSAFDPVAFGGMAAVLAGTALIACVLPARRAAAADPLVALRSE
jgi:putative ABC transport system permease protein